MECTGVWSLIMLQYWAAIDEGDWLGISIDIYKPQKKDSPATDEYNPQVVRQSPVYRSVPFTIQNVRKLEGYSHHLRSKCPWRENIYPLQNRAFPD